MNKITKVAMNTLAIGARVGLGACSNMTPRQQNTAVGAGVGAVAGSVLTGGSAVGTIGGAAVGGVIGHEIKK